MRTTIPALIACVALAGCAVETENPTETVPSDMVTAEDGAELGQIQLAPGCGEPADTHVRRGLALYHNMTFTEAETAFREAMEVAPQCALGYWGVAMSYVHTLWPDTVNAKTLADGRELLGQAAGLASSDRDSAYVSAAAAYYEDAENRTEGERLAAFSGGWGQVHAQFPDDVEAKSIYALSLIATAPKDPEYAQQRAAGQLLAQVRSQLPNHPGAMHYTIHAFDSPPLAEMALEVAHDYGRVIPENSHALHMTSHIFTRLGHWPDSIAYNRRGANVAADNPVGGRVSHHYLHALDYLAYAYLQQGLDDRAAAVMDEMDALGEMHDHAATTYAVAAIPVRLAIEIRDWDALDGDEGSVDSSKYPAFTAMPVFAGGLAAAHTGELDRARTASGRLSELQVAAGDMPGAYDWATQVEIQKLTLDAWIAYADGDLESAIQHATEAMQLEKENPKNPVTPGVVLPASEALADMLFELENYADAEMFYAETLATNPNRYRSLLGAGNSARLMGRDEAARGYYEQLLEIAPASTRAELDAVREYLAN